MPNSEQTTPSTALSRLRRRAAADPARLAKLLVLVLFLLLLAVSVTTLRPPDPRSASAPEQEFSAGRAMVHAEVIGKEPRPLGSAGSARARDYLVQRLTELGGTVEARRQPVSQDEEGTALVAEVTNIHARFPGSAGGRAGHVVLMAHYDSVPAGPGASDNGINVAAILEIVRALRADGTPRNTIDVLFTDGEEPGLLGAHAFVADDVLDPENTVVLNLEARGVSGPSIMFESGPGNNGALSALGAADRPLATSVADEVYTFLPNDTDFTEFKQEGFGGLNFAFVDGSALYHTPGDSVANLSPKSLQHQGDTVLATARELAGVDLTEVGDGGDDTYFTVGGLLLHYPRYLAPAVAVLGTALYAFTVWYAGRGPRQGGRRGIGRAALTFPLALAGAAAVGFGGWEVLCLVRPGYADLAMGDSYRPGWYRAAFLTLTCAAVVGWYLLLRRKVGGTQLTLGVWGWFTGLGLITAFVTPGASYLFAWAPLLGCAALLLTLHRSGRDPAADVARQSLAASVAALVALPLLTPVIVLLFPTLGLVLAAVPLIVAALLVAVTLPLLDLLPRRTARVTSWFALAAGTALILMGIRVDVFDTAHPRHTNLAYAWDADQGVGHWVSSDSTPPGWTTSLAGSERADRRAEFPTFPTTLASGITSQSRIATAASASGPAAPEVTVDSDPADGDGTRTVRLHIEPGPGASYVTLFADTSEHSVRGAELLGVDVRGGVNRPASAGPWKWGLAAWTLPADGLDITLRVTGKGEVPLRITSYARGLPKGTESLPDDLTWGTWGANLTDVTAVGLTVRG
ncbi:M20/M25/M40 family metallo-hydrolase [Streptomyces sp. NPDC050546]|uniref:M20/M25/M40 family metallo-hydrolase n=1 Tax=Streptomyces sp. NPDC050546 TaxID=3365628 RepID=UPI0037A350FE